MVDFWGTLAPPWQACLEGAWQAYCAGSLPIGAVVTDAAGAILSRGRNRRYEPAGEGNFVSGSRPPTEVVSTSTSATPVP